MNTSFEEQLEKMFIARMKYLREEADDKFLSQDLKDSYDEKINFLEKLYNSLFGL